MGQKTVEQALESLMKSCARMERCISDVKRSLFRFGIETDKWDDIIEKLVRNKYVDEKRYAGCFTREKSNLQGWSARRIENALKMKGIPKEYIYEALESYITEEKENENLTNLLISKKTKLKDTDCYVIRRKLFAYAAGKGYDMDDINEILDKICQNL